MKQYLTLIIALTLCIQTRAIAPEKVKPVKNIILLIADGTSFSAVSSARWLQFYRDPAKPKLMLDPWMCGTIVTCNSDAPIGDSAPTTSCYVTGHRSRAGYVATYPSDQGSANIGPVDASRAYAPMATLLEAGRQLKGKSAGLVFTCQFPHATPADCSAHYYNRGASKIISEQMVHNGLDVVIGGGNKYLTSEGEEYLKQQGVKVYRNDINAMRQDKGTKMWALYGNVDMAYDLDRNPEEQPSLAEMTTTAINKLAKNKKGFFLMVEGSKTDWAAHANDPAALPNEVLAFDKACGAAIDFARKDGNTAVIITVDHGNSGFSIGRSDLQDYSHASLAKLFGQVNKYKLTGDGLEEKINSEPFDSLKSIFKNYESIDLSTDEMLLIMNSKGYKHSPIPVELRVADKESPLYSSYLSGVLNKILTAHTSFGWTTGGHTAEEVMLACYNPTASQRIMGVNTNVELAHYMQALFGMYGKMQQFSDNIFARHADVFKGYETKLQPTDKGKEYPILEVTNSANGKSLRITPYTNIIEVVDSKSNSRKVQLPSVITYVDRNNMFYLPKDLTKYLK